MAARNVLTFRPSWNRHLSAESEASRAARWAAGSDASFFRGAMIPCFVPTRAEDRKAGGSFPAPPPVFRPAPRTPHCPFRLV